MRTSRSSTRGLVLVLSCALVPVGCSGSCGGGSGTSAAPSASASAASTASASATALRPRPNFGRVAGTVGALLRATSSLDLKDEQKAKLEKIASDLREGEKAAAQSGDGGMRTEMKEVQDLLVAGVKAGKVEPAKLEPHYAALEQSAKARQDREAEALDQLHAALEPAQRKALVESVRSTEEKRASRMKLRGDRGGDGGRPDGGRPGVGRGRFERLTRGIDLDAAQQKKVEALLPKEDKSGALREDAKKQMDATLAAFETDTFDAKKLEGEGVKQIRAQMEDQAKYVAQLVPVLTADQRERLAKNLGRPMGEGALRGHHGMGTGGGRDLDEEEDDEPR